MRRLTLLVCAAPAGLATGLLAWVLAGGAQAASDKLAPAEELLARVRTPRPPIAETAYVSAADLISTPLFSVAGAAAEPVIRLDGISLSRRRTAALISVNGAAAEWLKPGETRGDVTLQQVGASRIVVDTPAGPKEVVLGQGGGPPAAAPSTSAPVADPAAAGFRSPPPPASAPGSK